VRDEILKVASVARCIKQLTHSSQTGNLVIGAVALAEICRGLFDIANVNVSWELFIIGDAITTHFSCRQWYSWNEATVESVIARIIGSTNSATIS